MKKSLAEKVQQTSVEEFKHWFNRQQLATQYAWQRHYGFSTLDPDYTRLRRQTAALVNLDPTAEPAAIIYQLESAGLGSAWDYGKKVLNQVKEKIKPIANMTHTIQATGLAKPKLVLEFENTQDLAAFLQRLDGAANAAPMPGKVKPLYAQHTGKQPTTIKGGKGGDIRLKEKLEDLGFFNQQALMLVGIEHKPHHEESEPELFEQAMANLGIVAEVAVVQQHGGKAGSETWYQVAKAHLGQVLEYCHEERGIEKESHIWRPEDEWFDTVKAVASE